MSITLKSILLRNLNRRKAALLTMEARHATDSLHDTSCPLFRPGAHGCNVMLCSHLHHLRREVTIAETALKNAEESR